MAHQPPPPPPPGRPAQIVQAVPPVAAQLNYEAGVLNEKLMRLRFSKQELESELYALKAKRIQQLEDLEALQDVEQQLICEVNELMRFKKALLREMPHFESRARASAALAVVQAQLLGSISGLAAQAGGETMALDAAAVRTTLAAGTLPPELMAPVRYQQERVPKPSAEPVPAAARGMAPAGQVDTSAAVVAAAAAAGKRVMADAELDAAVSAMGLQPASPARVGGSAQQQQRQEAAVAAPAVAAGAARMPAYDVMGGMPWAQQGSFTSQVDGNTVMDLLDLLSGGPLNASQGAALAQLMGGSTTPSASDASSALGGLGAFPAGSMLTVSDGSVTSGAGGLQAPLGGSLMQLQRNDSGRSVSGGVQHAGSDAAALAQLLQQQAHQRDAQHQQEQQLAALQQQQAALLDKVHGLAAQMPAPSAAVVSKGPSEQVPQMSSLGALLAGRLQGFDPSLLMLNSL